MNGLRPQLEDYLVMRRALGFKLERARVPPRAVRRLR